MKSLSTRMKEYENAYDFTALGRVPMIVRIDGRKFSKYTNKHKKPFDESLSNSMVSATKHVASQMDGCVFAYTQSDEASFVLLNDRSHEQEPWFGNRIQKVISVCTSLFTASFVKSTGDLISFDGRFFALPNYSEVYNYLYWRQTDATRNSIQSASYHVLSEKIGRKTAQKLLHGLNTSQQQELLYKETGTNWNDYPTKFKRGLGLYKRQIEKQIEDKTVLRSEWHVDEEIPVFAQDREFLKNLIKGANGELELSSAMV